MDKQLVPGEGPKDAKIILLGEAPGEEEVRQRRPFVGKAGQLLNDLLRLAGINRLQCYTTNVVKERPPNNDFSHFVKHTTKTTVLTDAYVAYEKALYDEILQVNPNVIVALGNNALYAVCRLKEITKRRGSILPSRIIRPDGTPIKVVPTIHPARLLYRHEGDKAQMPMYIWRHWIVLDLKRAANEALFPEMRTPNRNIAIAKNMDDIETFLRQVTQAVGFDIEVVGDEVFCFSLARTPTDVIVVPLTYKGQHYWDVEQEVKVWSLLSDLLGDGRLLKVGQNIIFDASFLFRKFGIRVCNVRDTMVSQAILYPDFPKGLDFIASIFTREPYWKDERKKWSKLGGTEEDFWIYNGKDSAVLLEALPRLDRNIANQGNTATVNRHLSLIEPLIYMQERGIRMDLDGLRELSDSVGKQISKLTKEFHEVVGEILNPNSPAQLATYFYVVRGYKPYVKRGTGNVTVDHDALLGLSRKGAGEASLLLRIRSLSKLKSTYLDVNLDADGRLRGAYNPVGTVTGRLSSSETIFGTGTNMQNLPLEMEKLMLADPGYIMYKADLEQAENRVIAYVAPELNMIRAFESGVDIHRRTAGMIFGKRPEDISDEPGSSVIGSGTHSERHWGKKANHAFDRGVGYKTFARDNELPESEAKTIMARYYEAYPGIQQYHRWVQESLSRNGRKLTSCFGRVRMFLDAWGDELFRAAYSYIPQNTVAECLNFRGLVPIYSDPFFAPIELLNCIHDSLVIQVPLAIGWEKHKELLLRLKASLEAPIMWQGRSFSIPVGIKMGLDGGNMVKVDLEDMEGTYNKLIGETK